MTEDQQKAVDAALKRNVSDAVAALNAAFQAAVQAGLEVEFSASTIRDFGTELPQVAALLTRPTRV